MAEQMEQVMLHTVREVMFELMPWTLLVVGAGYLIFGMVLTTRAGVAGAAEATHSEFCRFALSLGFTVAGFGTIWLLLSSNSADEAPTVVLVGYWLLLGSLHLLLQGAAYMAGRMSGR